MTELRMGDKVLIPGTIVGSEGSGTAIIKTALGDRVVANLYDLVIDGPRNVLSSPEQRSSIRPLNVREVSSPEQRVSVRALSSPEERVERLARAMCTADSIDPDAKVTLGLLPIKAGGYLVDDALFPAWRLYAKYAQALIDKGLA